MAAILQNRKNGHISTTVLPISMKFGKVTCTPCDAAFRQNSSTTCCVSLLIQKSLESFLLSNIITYIQREITLVIINQLYLN